MKTLTQVAMFLAFLLAAPSAPRAEEVKLNYLLSLSTDEQGAGMKHPEGVACQGGAVTVADPENGRLLRYVLQKGAIAGRSEFRFPELTHPVLVRPGAGGSLFVLDGRQQRILRIGPDGTFKGYVETAGVPGTAQMIIKSFAVDRNGSFYLLDVHGSRVTVHGPDGAFLREIRLPAAAGFISDLAVSPKGSILLVDSVLAAVYAAAPGATAFVPLVAGDRGTLGFPTAIATDGDGTIFLLDRNRGSVVVVRENGSVVGRRLSRGWREGFLNYPSQLCISEENELFIADRNSSRVQVFGITR